MWIWLLFDKDHADQIGRGAVVALGAAVVIWVLWKVAMFFVKLSQAEEDYLRKEMERRSKQ